MVDDAHEMPHRSLAVGAADMPLSVPDSVYKRLRTEILECAFPPGHLLKQEELAKRFSASRVPIREALARLDAEGLINLRPRRGYVVPSLSPNEIREIFDIRAVLEEHAGSLAATNRSSADIRDVESILNQLSKLSIDPSNNCDVWLDLNYRFHSSLIAATGRERLCGFAKMLRDSVEPYIRIEIRLTREVTEAQQDHLEIFDAFRRGDACKLAALSRLHVEKTAARLLAGLDKKTRQNAQSPTSS
jgi:DNA-binding GntR family transcriptional regulator